MTRFAPKQRRVSPREESQYPSALPAPRGFDPPSLQAAPTGGHQFAQMSVFPPPVQARAQAGPTVQRFKTVHPGGNQDQYTLQQDQNPNARAPFTRFESDMSVLPAVGNRQTPGIGWAKHEDNLPPLRVAQDDTLAINDTDDEAKEFYATGGVIAAANNELRSVGSPINLVTAGNQITLGNNHLDMIQPHLTNQVAPPGQNEFIALAQDICRDTAKQIIGGSITHALVKQGDESLSVPVVTSNAQRIVGAHTLAEKLTQGDVTGQEATQAISEEDTGAPPESGIGYGRGVRNGSVGQRANNIGINESAKANVGQGYITQSIDNIGRTKIDYSRDENTVKDFIWGYHYSAVVAQSGDGADQIAMENYRRDTSELVQARATLLNQLKIQFAGQLNNVVLNGTDMEQIGQIMALVEDGLQANTAEAGRKYKEMADQYIGNVGSRWYFRIIGSQQGQSFHEQMASSPFFINPMTLVVANRSTTVRFEESQNQPNQMGLNALNKLLPSLLHSIQNNVPPSEIRIVGHGSGSKKKGYGDTRMGKKRAQAVADWLSSNGVNGVRMSVIGAGRVSTTNPSANRFAEVEVVR